MKEESVRKIAEVKEQWVLDQVLPLEQEHLEKDQVLPNQFPRYPSRGKQNQQPQNLQRKFDQKLRFSRKTAKIRLLDSHLLQKTPVIENLFMTLMTSILFIFCTCIVYFTQRK